MLSVGIDPDTCDTAFAWWDSNGPVDMVVAHVIRKTGDKQIVCKTVRAIEAVEMVSTYCEDTSVIVVEGQQLDKRKASVQSIFSLARVAGVALSHAVRCLPDARLLVPTPRDWTRGVAKHANQARMYGELGWGYEIVGSTKNGYARPLKVPAKFKHITKGQWKHVGDAMLLARWAQTQ